MRIMNSGLTVAAFAVMTLTLSSVPAVAMPAIEYSYPSAEKDGDSNRWDLKLSAGMGTNARDAVGNPTPQSTFPDPDHDGDSDWISQGGFERSVAPSGNPTHGG